MVVFVVPLSPPHFFPHSPSPHTSTMLLEGKILSAVVLGVAAVGALVVGTAAKRRASSHGGADDWGVPPSSSTLHPFPAPYRDPSRDPSSSSAERNIREGTRALKKEVRELEKKAEDDLTRLRIRARADAEAVEAKGSSLLSRVLGRRPAETSEAALEGEEIIPRIVADADRSAREADASAESARLATERTAAEAAAALAAGSAFHERIQGEKGRVEAYREEARSLERAAAEKDAAARELERLLRKDEGYWREAEGVATRKLREGDSALKGYARLEEAARAKHLLAERTRLESLEGVAHSMEREMARAAEAVQREKAEADAHGRAAARAAEALLAADRRKVWAEKESGKLGGPGPSSTAGGAQAGWLASGPTTASTAAAPISARVEASGTAEAIDDVDPKHRKGTAAGTTVLASGQSRVTASSSPLFGSRAPVVVEREEVSPSRARAHISLEETSRKG